MDVVDEDESVSISESALENAYERSEAMHVIMEGELELVQKSKFERRFQNLTTGPKPTRDVKSEALALIRDWFATGLIGFLVVSYWRGLWMLCDLLTPCHVDDLILGYPTTICFFVSQDQRKRYDVGAVSYGVGIVLHVIGTLMLWKGWWVPSQAVVSRRTALTRFMILLILGTGSVSVWRGLWYMEDYFMAVRVSAEASQTASWIALAVSILGVSMLCGGPALLAPPTIFILDGPSRLPPPIGVTLLSSYYSLSLKAGQPPPEHHLSVYAVDLFLSFGLLPAFVVLFWRCVWYSFDNYLWLAFTDPRAFKLSLGYGTVICALCFLLVNDDVLAFVFRSPTRILLHILRRVRVLMLAICTVSFWRVAWNVWDTFLGGLNLWSFWLAYLLPITILTTLGCMASTLAPPATLGSDAVACDQCAEEPLFSSLPVSSEALFIFSIAREAPAQAGGERAANRASMRESFMLDLPTRPSPRPAPTPTRRNARQSFYEMQRPGLTLRSDESVDYFRYRSQQRRRSTVTFRTR